MFDEKGYAWTQKIVDFLNKDLISFLSSIPIRTYVICVCFLIVVFIFVGRYKDYRSRHNFIWHESDFESDKNLKDFSEYKED